MAAGDPAFSRHELARLAEATGGGDDLTAAMPLICALKQIFSAYVKDGRSGRHRAASGHAAYYFLAPALEVANA